jgi:hypothetical protein
MNKDEIIEKLKDNQTPWKWLDDMDRDALIEAKKRGAMVFMDGKGYWQTHKHEQSMGVVYRIFKGYKANPERPELECLDPVYDDDLRRVIDTQNKAIQWLYDKVDELGC